MYKLLGIIGAFLIVVATGIGAFCDFPSVEIVQIAVAAFGLCSIISGSIKKAKDEKRFSWKTIVIIALAVVGGVLCCIGGLGQNIFAEIVGATLALLSVIFGFIPG